MFIYTKVKEVQSKNESANVKEIKAPANPIILVFFLPLRVSDILGIHINCDLSKKKKKKRLNKV